MAKGQYVLGYKWLYFLIALFFLTFIFLYMRSAFVDYQTEKVQCTDTALEEIMIAKVLYSDCFTYKDPELERTLPGTIDINKFKHETLATCFSYIKKDMQLKIEEKIIGETIADPITVRKIVWLYEKNEKRTVTLEFLFEEKKC